jgi:hypothetical protein
MSNSSTYLEEQFGLTHFVEIAERGMAVNTTIKAALTGQWLQEEQGPWRSFSVSHLS